VQIAAMKGAENKKFCFHNLIIILQLN
jgi:hypothetical protein